ncbi:hypothetical protein ACFWTC_03105 [Streptomyces sp. NPDC058619]|uniref:hypothetical protein n=1 Tax=unclassified Streptomyces TaxID=2593676 RepID=UPI00364A5DD6
MTQPPGPIGAALQQQAEREQGQGVCCGCRGAHGPVVYHNHRELPFCAHCADCSCGAHPCARPEQPGRHTADSVTDAALDQLYDEREQLLAELNGRDEEARERWIKRQLDETGLKAMDFRNGMTMDIEPARELVAHWVGAARAMLGDAENYSETPIAMEVKVAEDPERFAFTLQRVGKLTPHQARQQAEATVERVRAAIASADWPHAQVYARDIRAALDPPKES